MPSDGFGITIVSTYICTNVSISGVHFWILKWASNRDRKCMLDIIMLVLKLKQKSSY